MSKYSTEITAILATVLLPVVTMYFSEQCAGEVSQFLSALPGAVYLWFKRYQKGDITLAGMRKF